MKCTRAKTQDRRIISYSKPIIPDNKFSHHVKNLIRRCPELDEETVNNYFHIIGTLWNIVGVPLVREPAFDIPIVQFSSKSVLGDLRDFLLSWILIWRVFLCPILICESDWNVYIAYLEGLYYKRSMIWWENMDQW